MPHFVESLLLERAGAVHGHARAIAQRLEVELEADADVGDDVEARGDAALRELAPPGGYDDDIAIVVYRRPYAPLLIDRIVTADHLSDIRHQLASWLQSAAVPDEQVADIVQNFANIMSAIGQRAQAIKEFAQGATTTFNVMAARDLTVGGLVVHLPAELGTIAPVTIEARSLSSQAAGLRERLIALGHVRDEESFRRSWALIRLVLHRGDPDLTAVTFEDVEEMRALLRAPPAGTLVHHPVGTRVGNVRNNDAALLEAV